MLCRLVNYMSSRVSTQLMICSGGLQSERDRKNTPHINLCVFYFANTPPRHLANDAHSLAVECLVARAANNLNIEQFTIGANNKATQNTPLNVAMIGIVRIFTGFVDEVYHAALAARELRSYINTLILIHHHIVTRLVR